MTMRTNPMQELFDAWDYRDRDAAVVMLSGGQDSMTVLALAVRMHGAANVHTISFDYEQRHRVELEAAYQAVKHFNVGSHHVINVADALSLAPSALTRLGSVSAEHELLVGRPASFVPNRNALFMTIAHALAITKRAKYVYLGANQTDFSGYPDCRGEFIERMQLALNRGAEASVEFRAPLLNLTKAETFRLADQLGVLPFIVAESRTCYEGRSGTALPDGAGVGCGVCPACVLRVRGWQEFRGTVVGASPAGVVGN